MNTSTNELCKKMHIVADDLDNENVTCRTDESLKNAATMLRIAANIIAQLESDLERARACIATCDKNHDPNVGA